MGMVCFNRLFLSPPCSIMEWLDSLWAWVMSLLASLLHLFGISSVSEACQKVEPAPVKADEGFKAAEVFKAAEGFKAAEVFEALAAQVPPMLVELPEAEAPPNI